jgi:hypothetical protein
MKVQICRCPKYKLEARINGEGRQLREEWKGQSLPLWPACASLSRWRSAAQWALNVRPPPSRSRPEERRVVDIQEGRSRGWWIISGLPLDPVAWGGEVGVRPWGKARRWGEGMLARVSGSGRETRSGPAGEE